jgi:uncharacterized protein
MSEKYGYLLYNSLSNSFFELDNEAYNLLINIQNKKNIEINREEKDFLISNKILVNDDRDEFYQLKYSIQYSRFDNNMLELTINPTLNCNFACSYCFEVSKSSKYMSDEVENELISFINKNKNYKSLYITWFGGEPLLAIDRIESITKKVQKLPINYNSKIITNGYNLTIDVINKLKDLNINSIQITIDGLKDYHDNRRYLHSKKGTFEKIVHNIDLLKKLIPDFNVVIRVNIDINNSDNYIDVYNFFNDRYNGNIFISAGFVENVNSCTSPDCCFNRDKKVKFLIDQYERYGLNIFGFYPDYYRYECPVRNPNHIVIGPEGEIYKCYNDVGDSKKVIGNIVDKKITNTTLLTRYYVAGDPLDSEECKECFHFPTCGGGCPFLRMENEFDNTNHDTCEYIKNNLKKFLELHYDFKIRKSK